MNGSRQNAASRYYGPDAYRADAIPPLPAPPRKRERLGEDLLPFGDYAGIDPDQQDNAELVQDEDQRDPTFFEVDEWWWDHQRIRFLSNSFGLSVILLSLPYVIGLFLLCLSIFVGGHVTYFFENAVLSVFFMIVVMSIGIFLTFLLTPKLTGLLASLISFTTTPFHKHIFLHTNRYMQNRCSAFQRRTGWVSFAQGRNAPPFEAPFIEFDGYLDRVIQRGGVFYRLIFVHRYTGKSFHNTSFSSFLSHTHDVHAEWDMLQRYMDVSQPLPDIPRLEPFRHLDPTTAEHDRRTARDPRYWRDLDLDAWKQEENVARHRARIDYPWQRKRCRLTPQIGQVEMADYRARREREAATA